MRADLESHHIEGYANAALERGVDAYFKVDLISHIEGNLWMGGCMGGTQLAADFDYVISLYPWESYKLFPDTKRFEARMLDGPRIPERVLLREEGAPTSETMRFTLDELADFINDCIDRGKTLVHCQAGLNRSGLLCALALIRRGFTPRDAVDLLRERRYNMVLCNQQFERHLLGSPTPTPA